MSGRDIREVVVGTMGMGGMGDHLLLISVIRGGVWRRGLD